MNCVHLDFHTSPDIDGIGEKFNKDEFKKTLKQAHVDSITLFAKCHHGYTYYPSKIGTMHPNLKFNLLKEQIDACRSVGIKTPIYITMGWSKKDADEHPEWRHIDFFTKKPLCYGTYITPELDPETPTNVFDPLTKEKIPFNDKNGKTQFTVNGLTLHKLIVIEYD